MTVKEKYKVIEDEVKTFSLALKEKGVELVQCSMGYDGDDYAKAQVSMLLKFSIIDDSYIQTNDQGL